MQNIVGRTTRKIMVLILLVGAITFLHFLVPTDQHNLHKIHIVLRKLYFLPPVIAAAWYGIRGAVLVTLSISLFFSFQRGVKGTGKFPPKVSHRFSPHPPEGVRRERLLTLDQLTDIIVQGEQLDVEFKSDRRNLAFYGLTVDGISVMEGRK